MNQSRKTILEQTSSQTQYHVNVEFIDFLTYYKNLCNVKEALSLYMNNATHCIFLGMSQIDNLPDVQKDVVYNIFGLEPRDYATAVVVSAYIAWVFPEGVTVELASKFYRKTKEMPEHFELRLNLCVLIKKYIAHLELNGVFIGENSYIEYRSNKNSFAFFKNTQSKNRIINGLMAQRLARELIFTKKPIKEIFDQSRLTRARNALCQYFGISNLGINSEHLNKIIATAQGDFLSDEGSPPIPTPLLEDRFFINSWIHGYG